MGSRHLKVLFVSLMLCLFFAIAAGSAIAAYLVVGNVAIRGDGIAGKGDKAGQLSNPNQVDVYEASGDVYVADTGNGRVQIFAPTALGVKYKAQAPMAAPTWLAIDQADGDVYVASPAGISKYTASLTPAPGWVDPGVGGALAVDPSSGDLLVADTGSNLIRRYNADGSADGSFAAERPIDLAANSAGDIFVVTSTGDITEPPCGPTSAVERFSGAGVSAGTLSPLTTPGSVAVDPDDDSIVVAAKVNEYFCEAGNEPEVAFFDASGVLQEATKLGFEANYAIVPGLAAQGGGSTRVFAITRSPRDDNFGATQMLMLEDLSVPVATVAAADEVGPFAATLHGAVDPEGSAATCRLEYGTSDFGLNVHESVPCTPQPGSGTAPVAVRGRVKGLTADTVYYFRVVATSHRGVAIGSSAIESFTTAHAELPIVTLGAPGSITATGAKIGGTVDPLGNPTSYRFEYQRVGDTDWRPVPGGSGSAGSGSGPVGVEAELKGLSPNASYNVQLSATNGVGTVSSAGQEISTLASAPLVATLPAQQVSQTAAVLRASIDTGGEPTTYHFEYGPDTGYSRTLPAGGPVSVGSGSGPNQVSLRLDGLQPGVLYHYRVIAENGNGISQGGDQSFMTMTTPAGCPNEAVRERQGSQFLPDCRALEMVSPPQKNGVDVSGKEHSQYGVDFTPMSSASGDLAAFTAHGTFAGAKSNTLFTTYRAVRRPNGWGTETLTPYANGAKHSSPMFNFQRFDDELGSWFLEGIREPQLTPDAVEGTKNAYFWNGGEGGYRLLTPGEGPYEFAVTYQFGGWSDDRQKIVFSSFSGTQLTPEAPPGELNALYQWDAGSGEVTLVGKEPGTDLPFGSGAGIAGPNVLDGGGPRPADWNPVSADGSKVFFYARPVKARQLYVRVDGASTQHVSGSQRTTPDPWGAQAAVFHYASEDGEAAFFSSPEKLTDDATTGPTSTGSDLYRYEVAGEELTDITVDEAGANGAEVQGVLGGSDDGRRIYFVAQGELAPGAVVGANNLYLWTDDGSVKGQIEFVSTGVDLENWYWLDYLNQRRTGRVTPDGMHVLFSSRARLSSYDNDGHFETYLYDAASGRTTCVSCNPSGAKATADALAVGTGDMVSTARTLSDDGRFVFFGTVESLVPTDVNNRLDVYRYDSKADRIDLLSPGTGAFPAEFQDASADGTSAFFTTRQQLLTSDFDTNVDVYAARVDGGFLGQSPPPPPVPCFGEACRTEPVVPPPVSSPTSSGLHGKGNVNERKKAKKHKKKQRKQKKKKKKGKGKSKKQRGNR